MASVSDKVNDPTVDSRTKPPFLRRVRIRGYKSIAFCDVSLQPLTILVGRNAAGKSNFLDALAFLRDLMETDISEAVKHRGIFIFCRSSESAYTIELEVDIDFICGPARRVPSNAPSPPVEGRQ